MNSYKKKLRVAVIGLGRIGWQYHLPQIESHEGFELVAVVDPLPERLEEAKVKYNVQGFTDYTQMLSRIKPDLVVVASPTQFHCDQSILAFEYGADVFCEKPVVLNTDQLDKIIDSMQKHKRKFMVYQPYRLSSEISCLKHILEDQLVGDLYMIKRTFSRYSRRDDWQAFSANGGGMVYNYGSHFIDQLLYIAGFDVSYVKCFTDTIATLGDAEDVAKVVMQTDGGVLLDLDINCAAALPMRPWQLFGKYGSITNDVNSSKFYVRYFALEEIEPLSANPQLAAAGRQYCNNPDIKWQERVYDANDFDGADYYDKCYDYFALTRESFVPVWETRMLVDIIDKCNK